MDNLRQHGVVADLVGTHHETSGLVHCTCDDLTPRCLGDRHGLTCHHRLVHAATPIQQLTVYWNFLTGPDPQPVANGDGLDGDVFIFAITLDSPRHLWRQIEKGFDGTRRLLTGAQLKNLSKQHKDGNDCGGLKVYRHRPLRASERGREDVREECCNHAVDPGNANPHRNQGEHVQTARHHRRVAALKERPACPEYHRSCDCQLHPV